MLIDLKVSKNIKLKTAKDVMRRTIRIINRIIILNKNNFTGNKLKVLNYNINFIL